MSLLDPTVALALRGALLLLFASAAAHKLRDFSVFRTALASYEVVPAWATGAAAMAVAALEIGIALAFVGIGPPAAIAAAALLAVYTAAISLNLARGRRDIDCGCAGPASRSRISEALVVRNLILIAVALLAALPTAARSLVWLDAFTVIAAAMSLALVYLATETILANAARLRGVVA